MLVLAFMALLALLVAFSIGRTLFGLMKLFIAILTIFYSIQIGFAAYRFASLSLHRAAAAFSSHTWAFAGGALAVAVATALSTIGATVLIARLRLFLEPLAFDTRMRRAYYSIRLAKRPVTASTLAATADVDRERAITWLTNHPHFMPSPAASR
ncbi:hypothetical protein EPN44_14180 [bacterium]|nr:MAG: hypothetical protein EPN44_14180 [bacterium]